MAITFPNAPTNGQQYTAESGVTYEYNNGLWSTIDTYQPEPAVTVGATPPIDPAPVSGDLWWDTDDGVLYISYTDADNDSNWVTASPPSSTPWSYSGNTITYANDVVIGAATPTNSDSLQVTGGTTLSGDLSVTGTSTLTGNTSVTGVTAFTGGTNTPEQTISGSFDLSLGNHWTVGAVAIPNPTNGVAGASGLIRITAAPISWGSNFKFPAAAAPTITTFPAVIPFYVQDATNILMGNVTEGIA